VIAKAFAHRLDAELAAMKRDMDRRDAERAEAEIECFAAALRDEVIDAGDFAR